ncbi:hypothetical protein E1B28_004618 [Marasmius oreades]|uniref:BCD1 alpha/beta domain-containing protein n=1 Tax=Marasmius oreades TaxID=181124 RepID=A0A9P7UZ09_9AGAR|nr:uncharacterized protein E1B28_004618 [Marasmius oreades]KAG7097252.1 hypothetical protein E1B28_004618 [Marasmius oreades]
MNEYGYGEMMNDYVYLEEVGRRVKDWGGEIIRGGFDQNTSDRKGKGKITATSMRGGRGGRNTGGKGSGKSKREILKLQLETRNIFMELLPLGMEKKKLNQSTWDSRSQSASLTIEIILHPPHNPLASSLEPITLLTHRNNLSTPLIKLIESHVEDHLQKANKASARSATVAVLPDWIHDLFPSHDPFDSEAPTPPVFLMRVSPPTEYPNINMPIPQLSNGKHIRFYRILTPNDSLLTSLQDIPFVEFPTIEVADPDTVSEGAFHGLIIQEDSIHPGGTYQNHCPPKRQKVTVDKKAFAGLLHGYGSSESGSGSDTNYNGEGKEDRKSKDKSALEGLGGYDSSGDGEDGIEQQRRPKEEVMMDDSDEDEDLEVTLDAKASEELVKLAWRVGEGEEEVAWDDSDVE